MGLLDWLTEGLGSIDPSAGSMTPTPMASMPKPIITPGSQPLAPPIQPTADQMMTGGATPDPTMGLGNAPPPSAGLPPPNAGGPPPDPMLSGDAGLGAGQATGRMPPPQAEIPPAAMPTSSPGAPLSLAAPPAQAPSSPFGGMPDPTDQARGLIGRSLGLNPSSERRVIGSLSAGLKSVGDNWSKPGLAALSGSAGSALEGGEKAGQTEYDNKIKALTQAISYQKAGDEAGYKKAYVQYLGASLKDKTDKAASSKAAWNKPPSQLFLDAQRGVAADPDVKASEKLLEQVAKNGDPEALSKAQAAHTALVTQKRGDYIRGVGLDPKQYAAMSANPPGGVQNPHQFTGDAKAVQQQFDTYVRPGDFYVNPKDGKVYVRKQGTSSGGDSPAAASSPAAPTAPSNPMKPNNPPAPSDDDD